MAFAQTDITSNGKVTVNGKIINGLDQNGEAVEGSILSIRSKNNLDIANHQTYDSMTAGGQVDIANTNNGTLNIYGKITNKKGNTNLYASNRLSVYGNITNNNGNITMVAQNGNLPLAKGSLTHLYNGNLDITQQDILGWLKMDGQVLLDNSNINTYSLGNNVDSGLIFVGEFIHENDLDDILDDILDNVSNLVQPSIDYELSGNFEHGYDVTEDKDLKSSVKILRLHKDGATIVNENNWKIGEKIEIGIEFEGVNVMAQCKIIKAEKGVAQVMFLNLPKSAATKITERYMNKDLFHQWASN